jgi:hypothetical protein
LGRLKQRMAFKSQNLSSNYNLSCKGEDKKKSVKKNEIKNIDLTKNDHGIL